MSNVTMPIIAPVVNNTGVLNKHEYLGLGVFLLVTLIVFICDYLFKLDNNLVLIYWIIILTSFSIGLIVMGLS